MARVHPTHPPYHHHAPAPPALRLVTDDDEDALRCRARLEARQRIWLLVYAYQRTL